MEVAQESLNEIKLDLDFLMRDITDVETNMTLKLWLICPDKSEKDLNKVRSS